MKHIEVKKEAQTDLLELNQKLFKSGFVHDCLLREKDEFGTLKAGFLTSEVLQLQLRHSAGLAPASTNYALTSGLPGHLEQVWINSTK